MVLVQQDQVAQVVAQDIQEQQEQVHLVKVTMVVQVLVHNIQRVVVVEQVLLVLPQFY